MPTTKGHVLRITEANRAKLYNNNKVSFAVKSADKVSPSLLENSWKRQDIT